MDVTTDRAGNPAVVSKAGAFGGRAIIEENDALGSVDVGCTIIGEARAAGSGAAIKDKRGAVRAITGAVVDERCAASAGLIVEVNLRTRGIPDRAALVREIARARCRVAGEDDDSRIQIGMHHAALVHEGSVSGGAVVRKFKDGITGLALGRSHDSVRGEVTSAGGAQKGQIADPARGIRLDDEILYGRGVIRNSCSDKGKRGDGRSTDAKSARTRIEDDAIHRGAGRER